MGLELLRKEILDAAQAQGLKADEEATAKMHEIVRSAHTQAKALVEKARQEGKAFVDTERSERLSAARLEAGRTLSEAREAAVNSALEKVWAEFCKRRSLKGYAKELLALSDKASGELGKSSCVLHANAQDRKILLAAKRKVSDVPENCAGGVAAETPDGKIRVDCTFEEIFAQNREALRKEIYARMFGPEIAHESVAQKKGKRNRKGARAAKKVQGDKGKGRGAKPSKKSRGNGAAKGGAARKGRRN